MCGRCCERAERTHIKSSVDATVAFEDKASKGKKSAEVRSFTVSCWSDAPRTRAAFRTQTRGFWQSLESSKIPLFPAPHALESAKPAV